MLFGLTNAPTTIQHLMISRIVWPEAHKHQVPYSAYGLLAWQTVFDLYRWHDYIQCNLLGAYGTINFSYVKAGLKFKKAKLEAVTTPTDSKEFKSFIGLSNHYTHFIQAMLNPCTSYWERNQRVSIGLQFAIPL